MGHYKSNVRDLEFNLFHPFVSEIFPVDWRKDLDLAAGWLAARLQHLGAQGRPFLVQGLEHPNPETRRLCLENLSVSDLRCYGDPGRQLLVRLSSDHADLRIRERASAYLRLWGQTAPAPP